MRREQQANGTNGNQNKLFLGQKKEEGQNLKLLKNTGERR